MLGKTPVRIAGPMPGIASRTGMTASISLHRLGYATATGQRLFDGLELAFGDERSGLVGRNGVGKSTLLRLIDGELKPGSGSVRREGRIRRLAQTAPTDADSRVADAFGAGPALSRLRRIEQGQGSADDLAEADWTLPARMQQALSRMGLPPLEPERPLATLSGGQRTRVALAALIFDEPDFLLLDEPTNHLDHEGRELVAAVLGEWRGGALVVSHDRELLDRMDRIIELSTLGARVYGGNGSHYLAQKQHEREVAEQELDRAARKIREVEHGAQQALERKARRDNAGARENARGGQSRLLLGLRAARAEQSAGRGSVLAGRQREQAGAALQEARAQVESLKPLTVEVGSTRLPAGRTVLAFESVSGGPDPRQPVLRDLSFEVTGPERIAIGGPNGSGKSTLLRLAAGELEPVEGRVRRPLRAALLDQHVDLLRADATLLDNFRRLNPDDSELACRSALARFLFRNEAAMQVVAGLSGGERLRAGLACVLGGSQPPALLLLDEPTNHLDLEAIAAVETGLNTYDGALLVVSHDPVFLDAIGVQRTIMLEP